MFLYKIILNDFYSYTIIIIKYYDFLFNNERFK